MISTVTDLMAEALFASSVQPSDRPDAVAVHTAIEDSVLRYGAEGCAAILAAEYGDHPDSAVARMTWARQTVAAAVASRTSPLS